MQETQVRFPVQEDPTCRGAAKPVPHSYWACAESEPQLLNPYTANTEAEHPRAHVPQWEKPQRETQAQLESNLHVPQLEKTPRIGEDPVQSKINR